MQDKVHKLETEVHEIKMQQDVQSKTLIGIEKSLERMADMFEKIADLDHKFELLEKESNHKDELITGKIKGVQELTKKDIDALSEDFKVMTGSLKSLTWSVVGAVGSLIVTIILKQLGIV